MRRSLLLVCAVLLMGGCYTASNTALVVYRITGSAHAVKLDSMWVGNQERQCVGSYVSLPWVYRFRGTPDLVLGFTATKYDTGSCRLSIDVNSVYLDKDSISWASIGATADVWAQWP